MDPLTLLGITMASIVAGEAILVRVYSVLREVYHRRQQQEFVSSQVSNTM